MYLEHTVPKIYQGEKYFKKVVEENEIHILCPIYFFHFTVF
jgi:hypothetical protein